MTLTQAAFGQSSTTKNVALVLGGVVFIAAAAQVSVGWPVPMTLQTLAILLVGFAYGARLGAATLVSYLGAGLIGLPVFANFMNGVAFVGPTAGFLVGFVAMAWAAGWVADRGVRNVFALAAAAIVISALLYVPGLAGPTMIAGSLGIEGGWVAPSTENLLNWFMLPFLAGDAIKAVVAALIVTGAWQALKARG